MDIYEALMLICFAASWPFALIKTYQTKIVKGKSLLFLGLIIAGYLFGILHKVFNHPDAVIYLYIINTILVAGDVVFIYLYRNRPENL